ncbi:acyl-CoA dehydrogenase family protein [Nocardia alni]|uniref:acyl-CoA dehydrogenase family protein n=1 Tax=Nocardia alni TaxID=2815723 RepID=UPI001C24452D|nr:acyl-CoA dehydrogenase family protein [Nocardia alni]
MDFDLDPGQQKQLVALDEVIEACGGIDRARQVARTGGHDERLDAELTAAGLLDSAAFLDRVLIAERLAELGVATGFGLRAVVAADDIRLPNGPLAVLDTRRNGPVLDGRRGGPVRYAAVASSVLLLGDETRICEAGEIDIEPMESSFGFGYARVRAAPGAGTPLAVPAEVIRRRRRLALAAEIAGAAAGGIAHTAGYLSTREQFGKPLSTFQALRHRISEAAVSAEAARWMTREAAWSGDEQSALLAASYAAQTAAVLVPELTQMSGARGFTHEFGLHVYTMRLAGLRLELGAPDRIAVELAASRAH